MPAFKIKGSKSDKKYGVKAESLAELRNQGKKKLTLRCTPGNVIVQLEDDTIVDDEDYFSCLDPNTLLILSESKRSPVRSSRLVADSVDGMISADCMSSSSRPTLMSDSSAEEPSLQRIASQLNTNLQNIVKFGDSELQALANASPDDFSTLHLTDDEIETLQEACHTHLTEREKTSNAIELLKLFKEHRSAEVGNGDTTDNVADSIKKRPRLS